MKILKKDLKQGFVQLRIESLDDLWILHTILQKDDFVSGETERKIKIGNNDERNTRTVRKKMFLKIIVEETEFAKHSQNLRISGMIIDGPEEVSKGSFHTINVEIGTIIKINKEWKNYELEKLKKSEINSGKITLIALFDREEVLFAKLDIRGIEKIAEIRGKVAKKSEGMETEGNFWKEISNKAKELYDRFKPQHFIFASSGFWREYLRKELDDNLKKIAVFSGCSDVNMSAVNEVIKNPDLSKALSNEANAIEEIIIEELLKAIHDEKSSIGMEECYTTINSGKSKKFLVSEKLIQKLRQENTFSRLENLMIAAEKSGSKVHLIGSDNATKTLDGIGGVACINRW